MNAQQLRNSILQEAIEGRLVPQDPNDEPASALLERIREEKKRLFKEGELKKKDLIETPISEDEKPFDIPESWEWVRMQDVIEFVNGRAYKRDELLDKGKYKVLRVGNFFTNESWYYSDLELPDEKYCYKDDLLYAWSASFGPKIWDGDKTIFHYHIWNVKYNKNILYRDYLFYFFLIDKESIKSATTGSTMIHVSMENMKPRLLPLPPLAEQKRIVAKIEELLPKVEEYGKAQDALNKLNEELPEKLKKSVLQEAISGRLVSQDPNDEPASVLLNRIREEKKRLFKEGKLKKKDLIETPISEDEKPFEIPDSWVWCRIGDYANKVTDFVASGSFATLRENVKYYSNKEYAILVRTKDFQTNFRTDLVYTDRHGYDFLSNSNLQGGELILPNIGASIGKVFIVPKLDYPMTLAPNTVMIRFYWDDQRDWIYTLFCSAFGKALLNDISSSTAQGKFNKTDFKELVIPLPPLAEQKRIVAKIEEVFKEIDKLKA